MSYAVLEIPDFPLHARLRLEPARDCPVVIYTGNGRRAQVAHLDALALRKGLRTGMSAVQALGLCPDLRLLPRHDQAEAEATALLLSSAWRIAPRVEPTSDGLLTVDLSGREISALRRDLAEIHLTLAAQALPLRVGVAATPGVARFAAYQAAPECWVDDSLSFLKPLPIHLLTLTDNETTLFDSLGLRTLGDLARLPQASLTQRLGERGALLWARATGRDQRPLDTATPPSRYFASYELEHPVETLEPLLFLLRRFVDRLAAEVSAAGLATTALRLGLRFEDETTHERDFRLPQASGKPDALFRVLEQHLATLHTAASVNRLELELFPAATGARQDGLFEASLRDPHQFYDTLARAAALLGSDRIGTPCNANTHRPDAVTLGPPSAVIPEYHPAPNPPAFGPLLRRFRPPYSALVECAEETPAALACPSVQQAQGRIVQTRGPWRRSGEWWDNDAAWAREEWDVELDRGGLYRLTRTRDGWWLEGIYD